MTATTSAPRAHKPPSVNIRPTNLSFQYGPEVPRYWVGGDPFLTHFMDALSITFPEGERMFVDSVRAVRKHVKDPAKQKEIAAFIGQEALHSREHETLNAHLAKRGYPARQMEGWVKFLIGTHDRIASKRRRLAATCALEHVTAILGDLLLRDRTLVDRFDESVRPLWLWHAVEETEHKGVAFDVYQEVYGGYAVRIQEMLLTTFFLILTAHYFQARMLERDGLLWNLRLWITGLRQVWGRGGYLRPLIPAYFEYFRRDFHPWQRDNSDLIHAWKPTLVPSYAT